MVLNQSLIYEKIDGNLNLPENIRQFMLFEDHIMTDF